MTLTLKQLKDQSIKTDNLRIEGNVPTLKSGTTPTPSLDIDSSNGAPFFAAATLNSQKMGPERAAGQTFTPNESGSLSSIEIKIHSRSGTINFGGLVFAEIWSTSIGTPQSLLATSNPVDQIALQDNSEHTFEFFGLDVLAGTEYALVFLAEVNGGGDIYLGGFPNQAVAGLGTLIISFDGGSSWGTVSADLWFRANLLVEVADPVLDLEASTSGSVEIELPDTVVDYKLTMPSTQGTADSVLVNDGNGNLSWQPK